MKVLLSLKVSESV